MTFAEHTTGEPPVGDQFEGHKIRCAPMLRFPMGSTEELIYLPLMKRGIIVPSYTLAVLQKLVNFRPVEMHLRDLVTRSIVPSECIEQLSTVLKEARACGAVISAEELIQHCRSVEKLRHTTASIETLCIPTRDRPNELRRAMESYLANLRRWDRGCSILILDDSTSEGRQRDCRELVRAQARNATERNVLYAGLSERRTFAEHLCRNGLAEEVVAFALFGIGPEGDRMGANRNAFLLATAGTMAFSVDDDTVCDPGVAESTDTTGLNIHGEGESMEFWFYGTRQAALDAIERCDTDVIGRHEALLGKSLCEAVNARADCDIHMDEICAHLLSALVAGSGAIGITLNGVYGDSAMYGGGCTLLPSRGATRSRLTASKAALTTALESREVIRQASRLSIAHTGRCMGSFIGLDNRSLLPPFFPMFRNEDSIFGCLTQYCCDEFLAAHLPFSLLHAPFGARAYHPNAISEIRVSDIVLVCISAAQVNAMPLRMEERLRKVGSQLLEFGALRVADFREFLSISLWSRASRLILSFETAVKEYSNEPDYWAAEVRSRIEKIRSAVTRPEYLMPTDLGRSANLEDALRDTQRILSLYGRLLCEWPGIVAVARGLSTQGICLAQQV